MADAEHAEAPTQYVLAYPAEIVFERPKTKNAVRQIVSMNIASTRPDGNVVYKVQTNRPKVYVSKPNCGLLKPNEISEFTVELDPHFTKDKLASDKKRHRFHVLAAPWPNDAQPFDIKMWHLVKEMKLPIQKQELEVSFTSLPSASAYLGMPARRTPSGTPSGWFALPSIPSIAQLRDRASALGVVAPAIDSPEAFMTPSNESLREVDGFLPHMPLANVNMRRQYSQPYVYVVEFCLVSVIMAIILRIIYEIVFT